VTRPWPDGVASGIRRSWPDDPGIRYAGYTAWRGVTAAPFTAPAAGETFGRGERFGIVPMNDGRVYWFAVASVPANWPAPDQKAELVHRFGTWHDPIPALLHATDDTRHSPATTRHDANAPPPSHDAPGRWAVSPKPTAPSPSPSAIPSSG
jgi:hypothetical protein